MHSLFVLFAMIIALAGGQDSLLQPLAGKTVVLDPGHNGGNSSAPSEINRLVPAGGFKKACNTTGTTTNDGTLTESELTFVIARKLRARLEDAGARVVMTRTSNDGVGPCVNRRAAIGNRAQADAALSIHADGHAPSGTGFHVIRPGTVPGYNDGIQEASDQLAKSVRRELDRNRIGRSTYIGKGTGLDRRTDLAGLNLSHVPIVMLEMGNMRNARDAHLMKSDSWRNEISDQLAAAIEAYLRKP